MTQGVQCPRCGIATEITRIGEADVDRCGRCGGMFLDRGELNRVAERTDGDLEYSTLQRPRRPPGVPHLRPCPRCGAPEMEAVEFIIHTDIVLDHCDQCGGFWLDAEELRRINEEVRRLNEAKDDLSAPPMLWFARFIWNLPH